MVKNRRMNRYEKIAFKVFASNIQASKKYFIRDDGRIEALKSFGKVKKGDIGGFIDSEKNLSQKGNCWVFDDSEVRGNARVYDNARLHKKSMVVKNAQVFEDAVIVNGIVSDNAKVFGKTNVYDEGMVLGKSEISGDTFITSEKVWDKKIKDNKEIK